MPDQPVPLWRQLKTAPHLADRANAAAFFKDLRENWAKVGLDGHDRGVKVVARILRDAGFEGIYTGLFQTPETVAAAAVDEDADAIGLSMLSGAHMTLAPMVVEAVRARGADIPVIVGGIVPDHDLEELTAAGVAAVLTPGATSDQIVAEVRRVLDSAPVT